MLGCQVHFYGIVEMVNCKRYQVAQNLNKNYFRKKPYLTTVTTQRHDPALSAC